MLVFFFIILFLFLFFLRICGLLGLLPSVGLDVLAIRCIFWRLCGLSLALFHFFFFSDFSSNIFYFGGFFFFA